VSSVSVLRKILREALPEMVGGLMLTAFLAGLAEIIRILTQG